MTRKRLRDLGDVTVTTLTAGDVLARVGSAWVNRGQGWRALNAQADSYTLVLADRSTVVSATKGTAMNVTIPANATVAFAIGTVVEIVQMGAGQVTLVAGGAATIRKTAATLKVVAQYTTVRLRKVATDEWVVLDNAALAAS